MRVPSWSTGSKLIYEISRKGAWFLPLSAHRWFSISAVLSSATSKYSFPTHTSATPHETLNLPPGATESDIKKRYLELTKIYHPDTLNAQEIPAHVAATRFQAVAAAYQALQRGTRPLNDSIDTPANSEAEEIKKRLTSWGAAGLRQSQLDKARVERALNAERNAGRWWKTDVVLYYIMGAAAIAIAFMQFQGRSPSVQRERAKKYFEMRQGQSDSTKLQKET